MFPRAGPLHPSHAPTPGPQAGWDRSGLTPMSSNPAKAEASKKIPLLPSLHLPKPRRHQCKPNRAPSWQARLFYYADVLQ